MSVVQMLFSAKGRIRRSQYWLYAICLAIFWVIVEVVGHQLITGNPISTFATDMAGWMTFKPEPFNLFILAIMVLGKWPAICLVAKRWHDRGRSGWLAGITTAIGLGLTAITVNFGPQSGNLNWSIYGAAALISVGIGIWVFVECGCLDGTQGTNKYGPSPKGIDGAASVF